MTTGLSEAEQNMIDSLRRGGRSAGFYVNVKRDQLLHLINLLEKHGVYTPSPDSDDSPPPAKPPASVADPVSELAAEMGQPPPVAVRKDEPAKPVAAVPPSEAKKGPPKS